MLTRWLHFAFVFVLFGCSAAFFYLGLLLTAQTRGLPRTIRTARRLIRFAALGAFGSGLGWMIATLATMTDGFAEVFDRDFLRVFFFETPFGPIAAVRLLLLAALLVPVVRPLRTSTLVTSIVAIGALLLVSQAWLGHAAEGGDTLLGAGMIVSYAVHVLAGALWLGGLPILLLAFAERRRAADGIGTLELLSRFSTMGAVAVGAILISGVANTGFRVGTSFSLLVATTYGEVLFVKLGFVAAMLGLAAHNRLVAMPRLRTADLHGRLAASLQASIGLELVLGACVLAVVAVLGVTAPPR